MDTVYLGMSVDILHHGHINIINRASSYGEVVVGLLSDSAFASHKRLPYLNYEQREQVILGMKGVSKVVPQEEWDYAPNLRKYRPKFMVHGDDWTEGPLAPYRARAIEALAEFGGTLIEVPYTRDVSSTAILEQTLLLGTSPEVRCATLRRLIRAKRIVKIIEAHSPISALISEKLRVEKGGEIRQFDGFWSSSLTDSTEMGKPDIEALDFSTRLANINSMFDVTTKPLIMDMDTGGKPEHFEIHVRTAERLGISAVIIEDKIGLKKNSLFGNDVTQSQDDIENFCNKLRAGRNSKRSDAFMIIARIESLILDKGIPDALTRARAYIDAGADGIMIHSRKKQPTEVFEFAKLFRYEFKDTPLVAVPSSYNAVTDEELVTHGFNIVIYANQLLRASYPAMRDVATSILTNGRSYEAENQLIGIDEILELIPGTK